MNYAKLCKATRKKHALTQQELAKMLGISQGSLSKIESSIQDPSADTLLRLLHMFHTADYLLLVPRSMRKDLRS